MYILHSDCHFKLQKCYQQAHRFLELSALWSMSIIVNNLSGFINEYSITLGPLNNSTILNLQFVLQCQGDNDHK